MGKTYVTGLILKKLHENHQKAAYYKAAMSGNERNPDGSLLHRDNRFMCERMTGIKTVACVGTGDQDLDVPFEELDALYE